MSHLLDWVGDELVSEWGGGDTYRAYVPGPGQDEYLLYYTEAGKTWLYQDERGSLIAQADNSGAVTSKNVYDDYGVPAAANAGTTGYAGQLWLPELGLSYARARMYAPNLGRFMQTDPIGIAGGINLYA